MPAIDVMVVYYDNIVLGKANKLNKPNIYINKPAVCKPIICTPLPPINQQFPPPNKPIIHPTKPVVYIPHPHQ